MKRIQSVVVVVAAVIAADAGCGGGDSALEPGPDASAPDAAQPGPPDASAGRCASGKAGAPCVLALYDVAVASCTATDLAALTEELDARRTLGPLWAAGRALIRTDGPRRIAGSFNAWDPTALAASSVCGSPLTVAVGAVPSGAWAYKLVDGDTWSLDPHDPAFVYDDFDGNADGANSSLVTPDAASGQLVHLDPACSTALGNCRDVIAYLPPGYDAPNAAARTYPVLFMHDGQNVFDDHDCCFGHTGWEVNVAMDAEIAAGRVAPAIVIAAYNTTDRNNEYGLDGAKLAAFVEFQVTQLQPAALTQVRWDQQRVAVAGSSLGGLVAMHLGLEHPETYRAVASLSGAFWPGMDDGTALRDRIPVLGKQDLAIYLDHGGAIADNSDGAADSVEVRDLLVGQGWNLGRSPSCVLSGSTVCYHHEPGATHDELAWKARTWRFLRFLLPAT